LTSQIVDSVIKKKREREGGGPKNNNKRKKNNTNPLILSPNHPATPNHLYTKLSLHQPPFSPTSMDSPASSPIYDYETTQYFEKERFKAARWWQRQNNQSEQDRATARSEHHVARYVMLIILRVFDILEWNIVPQFYTLARMWPDLVLESFEYQPGRKRSLLFVPRVYIELKHENNSKDPIQQLLDSIAYNKSYILSSKGYLIGITGTNLMIMDFQRVITYNPNETITLLHNFYENPYNMGRGGRPIPSKAYTEREGIDISTKEGFEDMLQALRWITKNKESRNFANHNGHVNRLPESLTVPTLAGMEEGDELDLKEFEHMSDLFSSPASLRLFVFLLLKSTRSMAKEKKITESLFYFFFSFARV